ncbi:hypothetical protein BHE74_00008320 [Ensete ventricosum]|nr:hypothetical protein BHE74_00008320 [Ensete ventricosum]
MRIHQSHHDILLPKKLQIKLHRTRERKQQKSDTPNQIPPSELTEGEGTDGRLSCMLLTVASDVLFRISYPGQISSPPSGARNQIQADIVSCLYVRRLLSVDELEETSRIPTRFVQPTTAALPPPLSPLGSLSLSCLSSSLLFFRCRFFIPASALGALKDCTVALLSVFGPSPCGYMIRLDLSSTHKEDCRFDVSSCCAEGCVIVIEWRAIFYVTLVDVRDPAMGTGPAAEDRRSTASGAYGSPHVTVPSHETLSSSIIFSLR